MRLGYAAGAAVLANRLAPARPGRQGRRGRLAHAQAGSFWCIVHRGGRPSLLCGDSWRGALDVPRAADGWQRLLKSLTIFIDNWPTLHSVPPSRWLNVVGPAVRDRKFLRWGGARDRGRGAPYGASTRGGVMQVKDPTRRPLIGKIVKTFPPALDASPVYVMIKHLNSKMDVARHQHRPVSALSHKIPSVKRGCGELVFGRHLLSLTY